MQGGKHITASICMQEQLGGPAEIAALDQGLQLLDCVTAQAVHSKTWSSGKLAACRCSAFSRMNPGCRLYLSSDACNLAAKSDILALV